MQKDDDPRPCHEQIWTLWRIWARCNQSSHPCTALRQVLAISAAWQGGGCSALPPHKGWFMIYVHKAWGLIYVRKNGRKPAGDVNWRCLASCLHWMFPAFCCVFPPWQTVFWHRQTKTCTKTLALGTQPAASQHSTLLGSCRWPCGMSRETNGVHSPPGPGSEGLKLFCFL